MKVHRHSSFSKPRTNARREIHRNPMPPRRPLRGFTLVEVMVATFIVAIGMTATLSMLMFSRLQNELEQERSRAYQIVTEEMEQVRHELFTRISGGKTTTVWDNGTTDTTTDDTIGTLAVIVRDPKTGAQLFAAPVPASRVQVEVTLIWNPRGRLKASKTMRETAMTYIAP